MRELSTRRPPIKREKQSLCNTCRVLDYGACPNQEALFDSGFIDKPVTMCRWKDFFDGAMDKMQEFANYSNGNRGKVSKPKRTKAEVAEAQKKKVAVYYMGGYKGTMTRQEAEAKFGIKVTTIAYALRRGHQTREGFSFKDAS